MEKLAKVTAIVFDKTGTLTENKLSIEGIFCQDVNHVCNDEDTAFKRSLAYSLTKSSRHPISQSVATWLTAENTKEVSMIGIKEVAGKGVTGMFENTNYYLGSLAYAVETTGQTESKIREGFHDGRFESGRELYLFDDKEVLSLIKIHDTVKADAKAEDRKSTRLNSSH